MNIKSLLNSVYQPEEIEFILEGVNELIEKYKKQVQAKSHQLSEKDVILITYGDQLSQDGESKLNTLHSFMEEFTDGLINTIHILPFYPYTSDDGFSVQDYYAVNPDLGSWEDVEKLSNDYQLMFDAVINHISQESEWVKGYLAGQPEFDNYFINENPEKDFSKVTRPRVLPLLHEFINNKGEAAYLWTTFSKDQVDVNYQNPKVFLHILDVLLFYVAKGATLLRLDAIGFMWKEDDSTCIHLPQTHALIKVMREIIAEVAPSTLLVTETNVPHLENISYFGNGFDEAHMVYNFTLPPLTAYSLLAESTTELTQWAKSLELPSNKVCFFNFLASHDGVGVRPVDGILSAEQLQVLTKAVEANDGRISYKTNSDGSQSPYELNCNYFSLLNGIEKDEQLGFKRTLLAHALMMVMPGVPAIYFHSLTGSKNYVEGIEVTGMNRTINREKLAYRQLKERFKQTTGVSFQIFSAIKALLKIRTNTTAFHPFNGFTIHDYGNSIFAIERIDKETLQSVLCIFNFSKNKNQIQLNTDINYTDLLTKKVFKNTVDLEGYEFVWLKN